MLLNNQTRQESRAIAKMTVRCA